MSLLETIRKAGADGDADFLREGVKALAEAVMEAEVTELTGVPRGVRDPEHRSTHRNGYRERRRDTRVGIRSSWASTWVPRTSPSRSKSPLSVARGLQRIGRAGHQVGEPSRGVIFPQYRGDLLETAVVTRLMHEGTARARPRPSPLQHRRRGPRDHARRARGTTWRTRRPQAADR